MDKKKQSYILAVDLDNTLIKTDMIYVGLKFLLIYRIYLLPKLIWLFLFKGRTYAKKYLFDVTSYSVENIIFNQSVIDFITNNKEKYSYTILISGSYYEYVDAISEHLGLFDFSVGTTLETNMISSNKTRYLKDKFGDLKFDYIGDSKKDIPIWESARTAYVVNNTNIIRQLKHIKYKIIS